MTVCFPSDPAGLEVGKACMVRCSATGVASDGAPLHGARQRPELTLNRPAMLEDSD